MTASSTGALNAAVALGGPVATVSERLTRIWFDSADLVFAPAAAMLAPFVPQTGPRFASAMETLVIGRAGLFHPRPLPFAMLNTLPGHLSLEPLRHRLEALVDFDRLNRGPVRLSVSATDLESGEQVVFDTGRHDRIGPDEILASCAMAPLFAPIPRDGRLLGDGGLTANAPIAAVLRTGMPAVVLDLLPRAGARPDDLSEGAARAAAIALSSQAWTQIDGARERHGLQHRLAGLEGGEPPAPVRLVMLEYAVAGEEPGMARLLDFRAHALSSRWSAGEAAIGRALDRLAEMQDDGFVVAQCS